MNNATSMLWRTPCRWSCAASRPSVLRSSLLAQLQLLYPTATQPMRSIWSDSGVRPLHSTVRARRAYFRTFHSSTALPARRQPQSNATSRKDSPAFLERDLPPLQISQIFGTASISASQGNQVLRALQNQRLLGTLDLPLPADIARVASPHIVNAGLAWLRRTHSVDEDAAILARIEREEQEEEDRLIRRAEELGLYKPQSGRFGASTAKEGDVYGNSVLEEVRKENMKASKKTEEQNRQDWLDGEAKRTEELQAQAEKFKELQKFEPLELTEARPRADPNVRPALAWIQQQHLKATATNEDASNLTTTQRILPSLGVVLLTLGLCYLFSETYTEPDRHQRLWPDIRPAAATVVTLVGLNLGVFVFWKFIPPAWRLLNRYFVSVPYYPHAASVVGSVFSHQQLRHLASNMLVLWFIGMRLHEEVGRGDFLAAYLSSGAFATFTSFAVRVFSNHLTVSSLGASGAISGIVAMWCIIHSNDKLTIAFLPSAWQPMVSASGSTFLGAIILVELLNFVPAFRLFSVDLWSHLGGYAIGIALGLMWKEKKAREKRNKPVGWLDSFRS